MTRLERWIFPPTCVLTQQRLPLDSAYDLAPEVLADWVHRTEVCPICNELSPQQRVCGTCLTRPSSLDATLSAFDFEGDLRDLLLRFKYQPAHHLGLVLAQVSAPFFQGRQVDALVPVPIHVSRLLERGFNQASVLAQHWGRLLKLPVVTQGFERVKATESQTHLTAQERQHNLKGAFALNEKALAGFQKIALVDDVITTGATTQALAELFKTHQPNGSVEAWSVAKTR